MNDELDQDAIIGAALRPIPLGDEASRRIRGRLGADVGARRAALLDGALHGGFAIVAVAWTLLVVVGR